MTGLFKEKLVYSNTLLGDGDNVGAWTLDGYGNPIGSTGDALHVTMLSSSGSALDVDWGTVGANTLRTASEVGNESGIADFDAGATTAQTLRTTSNLSDGYGIALSSTGGALNVTVTNATSSEGIYNEGSANSPTDFGQFVFAVRQDSEVSVVADGEYAPFTTDYTGRLKVNAGNVADGYADSENPVKTGTRSVAAPLSVTTTGNRSDMISDLYRRVYVNDNPNIAVNSQAVTVGTGAVALPTTALSGRMRLVVQNLGSKAIFIGPSGVTTTSGMQVSAGSTLVVELGDAVNLYGISTAAGQNVRVFELA